MRGVKRALMALAAVLVALATLVFMLENQQPVAVILFGWSAPELPIAAFIAFAFLLGMLIGPLLGWFVYGRLSIKVASLRRELAASRKQLAKLTEREAADQP